MRSAFFEFNVAITGLYAARAGLETVNHNTANASTAGYSRQYIEQRAAHPLTFYNGKGMIGTGVDVYGIGQYRNSYLDTKYWTEMSVYGEYSTKKVQLEQTQAVFGDLSDTGLTGSFNSFFSTLQDLSVSVSDTTNRTNALQYANSLVNGINLNVESLKKQQRDLNGDVVSVVSEINNLGHQIRTLNEQISKFEIDGSRANDLRDQRANLVDQLSQYVNVEVKEVERNADYAAGLYPNPEDRGKSDRQFVVLINGEEFINHYQVYPLRLEARTEKLNSNDIHGLYDIYFSSSNKKFDIHDPDLEGQLKGIIDMRDGNNGRYCTGTNRGYSANFPNSLVLDNLSKGDINDTGYLELFNPNTGIRRNYTYEIVAVNADGSIDIQVTDTDPSSKPNPVSLPANADTMQVNIGKTTSYKGIPHYLDKINQLVRTFVQTMNDGIDRNGNPIDNLTGYANGYNDYGDTGIPLFTYLDKNGVPVTDIYQKDGNGNFIRDSNGKLIIDKTKFDYNKLTAENMVVNPDLLSNPDKMSTYVNGSLDESENTLILELLNVSSFEQLFAEGKLSDFINGISSELGIDLKQAENFAVNYHDVVTSIDNQRISYSGVDINEEMIMMVKYQQLYQAASKMINTINNIYDIMINQLGV